MLFIPQASPNGNPTGPWTHYTDIFPNRTRAGVSWAATTASNPAVIFTKNGSALMAFHGKDRVRQFRHHFGPF